MPAPVITPLTTTLPPLARSVLLLATAEVTERPALPVASMRPALVTVAEPVLMTRALLVPVASITPAAWLIRVSWEAPS